MKVSKRSKAISVEFRFSPIYDDQCHASFDLLSKHERPYPDAKATIDFMHRLEKDWRKNETKIFKAIQRYTGIRWATNTHLCYVVGSGIPFSDPLTMPVFAPQTPTDYVSDVLCHELIHRNLIEPAFSQKWKRVFSKLKKQYPKDTENTLVHVLVHAIHEQIFLSIFSDERLKRDKRIMSAHPDYRRAWEIVESVGAKMIIETYFKI
ncbi:MAG: hypothetical protein WCK01_05280 [Candidatus Uhrbacteria bacterium]